ncbi:MAG TPA: efflux transporter outer membrane subunit [Ramlibacter sp.]|nr:efflux transporter outer membrane subunit [Ramlibacter sp.]
MKRTSIAIAVATLALLAGCALTPAYHQPDVDTPVAFKEGRGEWIKAVPADTLERGPWWELFADSDLTSLASQVEVNNQNVALAVARYAQARALVAQQRASLFPTVNLSAGATRSGSRQQTTTTASGASVTTGGAHNNFSLGIGGSWEPDVWGRLRAGVDQARASEQASASDLQAAKLSAQGELATDYFNIRQLDVASAIQAQTIAGYQRTFTITQNRYNVGVAPKTDLLQAQTQLANAKADQLGLEQQRATLEHAIAVLIGKAPANFSLAARPVWNAQVPDVPISMPSTLLQRRPDIAAAERRVAAANEQIGIARAGYFPSLNLSANAGLGAASIGDLFKASALTWAIGASLAQTIFNGGLTSAQVESARAGLDAASAQYRQAVLTAFQDVEDRLVASRILQDQLALREEASQAANLVEQQVLNRYQAGQVSFTDVVTAQVTAANARRAVAQAMSDREVAAVGLITALGGGWKGL